MLKNERFVKSMKFVFGAVLAIIGVFFVFSIFMYFLNLNKSAVSFVTLWTVKRIIGAMIWMFTKIFFITIPCLILPIILYCLIYKLIGNSIVRFFAGLGCTYLFYMFSDDLSFSSSAVMNWVKMLFQIYFLLILVMPQELIGVLGGIVSAIGAVVIYIFPDAPSFIDDIAAISSMILIIFVYLNSLAIFIKRIVASVPFFSHNKTSRVEPA